MKCVGVLPHHGKPRAIELAADLVRRLEERGVQVCLDRETAALLGRDELGGDLVGIDVGLILGGDGAFLREGRRLAEAGVPMLGINFGRLGFLAEVEPEGVDAALDRLLSGDYVIEERLMLRARVLRGGSPQAVYYAINDVVVARGTLARTVHWTLSVDNSFIGHYSGDGIIVSSPTGSTAYSLSAGGPIVHPGLDALVVTPICPHTWGSRPIVTAPEHTVVVRFEELDEELLLTIDGQFGEHLHPGDEVWVDGAEQRARLIRFGNRTFYDLLRQRLARKFSDDLQGKEELREGRAASPHPGDHRGAAD